MAKIKDLSISKEKYDHRMIITKKIDKNKFIEYVEQNNNYWIWAKDTLDGKKTLENPDNIPEEFREGIIMNLETKTRAYAEYDNNAGFYRIYIDYNEKYGQIIITIQKQLNKKFLLMFLELANYVGALLLSNTGKKIVTKEMIEESE